MRLLSDGDVAQALAGVDPVAVVERAFRLHGTGETVLPDEAYLAWKAKAGSCRSINMPAYLGGPAPLAGTKIINANPANVERGMTRAAGLVVLYDVETAAPYCVMSGARVSALRTASVTAVAVKHLARKKPESLGLIGAGPLAAAHARLLVHEVPSLASVQIYDHAAGRAQELAALLDEADGVAALAVDSAEASVKGCDIVVPVTTTTAAYMPFGWLAPGTTVVNVSLDDVCEDAFVSADMLVVDDWHLVRADDRRKLGRLWRQGVVAGPDEEIGTCARRIDAELAEVVMGTGATRTSDDEIVLVNPFGMAVHDIALAGEVYARAEALGLGVSVEL